MSGSIPEFQELQRQLSELQSRPAEPPQAPAPPTRQITCPGCKKSIEVLEEYVGKYFGTKIECSLCGHVFRASDKSDQQLQAELRGQAEELQRVEEAEQALNEARAAEEQRLLELAARGALADELPDGLDAAVLAEVVVDHSWPYDHHAHPQGMPIARYIVIWVYTAIAAVACWGLYLFFAWPELAEVISAEGVIATSMDWAGGGSLNLVMVLLVWTTTALCGIMFQGLVGAIVSHGKGRPRKEGFVFGAVLGPMGWILAGLMPNQAVSRKQ